MLRRSSVAPPVKTQRQPNPATEPVSPVPDETARRRPAVRVERAGPAALGPIIKSKIQPPALRSTTLTRQRLIDQLEDATTHRLTLLIAEAGYGKTTLLADFAAQSGMRTLWYRLDETDSDAVDWTNHIIAAAREFDPAFGTSTVELLGEITTGGPPKSAFLSSLISELAGLDAKPTLLVLDDFHVVDDKAVATEFVARLARDAPPWLHLLISSRRQPSFERARLAVAGQLAEIRTDDLRFSYSEIEQLFSAALATPLDQDVLRTLEARTRGWAASLVLFERSAQGRPPGAVRSLVRALSGATSPIYDFLAEEVITNLPHGLEALLMRASVLSMITPDSAAALLSDDETSNPEIVRDLLETADQLGLITHSSRSSESWQYHPLLREFLLRRLRQQSTAEDIRTLHMRVARSLVSADPLSAAHHFAEAGAPSDAMHYLGESLILTVGSGRWGEASELIGRIAEAPAGPAVAAIRARQFMESGELSEAAAVLEGVDVSKSSADVRAVFRHTQFWLGWRTGRRELMSKSLEEIRGDETTPPVLREIADVLVEGSYVGLPQASLPVLANRLQRMAETMSAERLTFYSAIGLHDSLIAYLNAGEYVAGLEVGSQALEQFARLGFFAPEQLSTHVALATCEYELGNEHNASLHRVEALASGREFADVPSELALIALCVGDAEYATELVTRARLQQRQNQSDAVADSFLECVVAFAEMGRDTAQAIDRLTAAAFDGILELGLSLARDAILVQALLLAGRTRDANQVLDRALPEAQSRGARRTEIRLSILAALANRDRDALLVALADADRVSKLAIPETAEALIRHADLLTPVPETIARAIELHPRRWLPGLRQQLGAGNTPEARAAAQLLDRYGSSDDVGLLRAYAKTYAKRGVDKSLGKALARRVSPRLEIRDLGRALIGIGSRSVPVTRMRRKPASVLIYLVTRPGFVANREEIIDDLWPEADPVSGTNNLNQSLYFLRREIDPWFDDDVSVDYVGFQGDLVWLERDLVAAQSASFVSQARLGPLGSAALELLHGYGGRFAPEFEYEEWADGWRARVHSTFLELANTTIENLVRQADVQTAVGVAAHALEVDPDASDIERRLVWLYGQSGQQSAARVQHAHLTKRDEDDEFESVDLIDLLAGPLPTA